MPMYDDIHAPTICSRAQPRDRVPSDHRFLGHSACRCARRPGVRRGWVAEADLTKFGRGDPMLRPDRNLAHNIRSPRPKCCEAEHAGERTTSSRGDPCGDVLRRGYRACVSPAPGWCVMIRRPCPGVAPARTYVDGQKSRLELDSARFGHFCRIRALLHAAVRRHPQSPRSAAGPTSRPVACNHRFQVAQRRACRTRRRL